MDASLPKPRVFLVRKDYCQNDNGDHVEESDNNPLPKYSRTRTVVLRQLDVDGDAYVSYECDCFYFMRKKCICRHLFRVLDWKPSYKLVFPECLKAYQTYIINDTDSFKKCRDLTALFKKHKSLVLPGTLDSILLNSMGAINTLAWFEDAQNRIIDVNDENEVNSNEVLDNIGGNFEIDDDEDSNIPISHLVATPVVPPVKKNGEAFTAYLSQYSDVCNFVERVDDDMDRIFEKHLSSLRSEILRHQSKSKEATPNDSLASFPGTERAPHRTRKRPYGEY